MSYSSDVLASSPLAYWPLGEPLRGTATRFHDLTGNGYDGTLATGTATAVAGPFGTGTAPNFAFTYQPTSDAVFIPQTVGFPLNGDPYTFEGWCKPVLDDSGTSLPLFSYGPPAYYNRAGQFIEASWLDLQIFGDFDNGAHPPGAGLCGVETDGPDNDDRLTWRLWPAVPPLMDGSWHQIALTDDAAGTIALYCDGALVHADIGYKVGTGNGVLASSPGGPAQMWIGDPGPIPHGTFNWVTPARGYYQGAVAHWSVYKRALPLSEINAHYRAALAWLGSASSTGLCWSLHLTPLQPSGQLTWDGFGSGPPAPTVPLLTQPRLLYAHDAAGNLLWSHDGTIFVTYKGGVSTRTWGG